MVKSQSYVLDIGKGGSQRLEEQHRLYENASRSLLLRAGLKKGMRVLEVGCGTGAMSFWIAEKIGPQGKLVATDISQEQLELARKSGGKNHIEFKEWDILKKNNEWVGQFDLIYCRFLLGHLTQPRKALEYMTSYLCKGGSLACDESSGLSTCFCSPRSEALEKVIKLHLKLQEIVGIKSIGNDIYSLFSELGLQDIQAALFQPVLSTPSQKSLLFKIFQEFSSFAVERNLISKDEARILCEDLNSLSRTDSFIGYIRITSILGYCN